jgi:hypothetical protein
MREALYVVPPELLEFTVDPASPTYWQELAAYCWVGTQVNKSIAGMKVIEITETEVSALQSDMSVALASGIAAIDALYPA